MILHASDGCRYEGRRLARLILFSVLIGALWYLLATLFDGSLLPREVIPKLDTPTADAVSMVMGPIGRYEVVFAGIPGILTTHVSLARGLLPEWFSMVHPKYVFPVKLRYSWGACHNSYLDLEEGRTYGL